MPQSTTSSSASQLPLPQNHVSPSSILENPLLDPLFVPYNELGNVSLVPQRLIDESNYVTYRKLMERQLDCKNKMDFVTGKIPTPEDATQLSK